MSGQKVEFLSVRVDMNLDHGPHRTAKAVSPNAFSTHPIEVHGCIRGWKIETTRNSARKYLDVHVEDVSLAKNPTVEIGLLSQDFTGNADDDYGGWVDVLIIGVVPAN